jgi:mannonate dehydratase
MKATLPVAAEAGVRMSLHPDDPPLAVMNGVGKMFVHYDGYARAERIAEQIEGPGAPHWGLTFCVGTWSEGGDRMGKDVFGMIEDFGGRGKLCEIHFRAVSSPLPDFYETFPDEGYLDLYQVMRALRQVRFTGAVMPDHVPRLAGDTGINRAGTAYCIAYMRALLERANQEVG